MRFLVKIVVRLPGDWDADRKAAIRQQERARVFELFRAGRLLRMFRIAGETGNVGIWEFASLQELHETLTTLPMLPWMTLEVTPLLPHPHEAAFAAEGETLSAL